MKDKIKGVQEGPFLQMKETPRTVRGGGTKIPAKQAVTWEKE